MAIEKESFLLPEPTHFNNPIGKASFEWRLREADAQTNGTFLTPQKIKELKELKEF